MSSNNHFSSQKTRLYDLSYFINVWTDLSFVLSQSTRLTDGQTDGRTDEQTALSWLVRAGIPCSAVTAVNSVRFVDLLFMACIWHGKRRLVRTASTCNSKLFKELRILGFCCVQILNNFIIYVSISLKSMVTCAKEVVFARICLFVCLSLCLSVRNFM